tara:strand:- start:947 stop:1345 length:399 start_codon:yes stop_codon:yes gene_type:complete
MSEWYRKCLPKHDHLLNQDAAKVFDEAQSVLVEKDVKKKTSTKDFKIGDLVTNGQGYFKILEIIEVEVWNLLSDDPNKPLMRHDLVVHCPVQSLRSGEINFVLLDALIDDQKRKLQDLQVAKEALDSYGGPK